MKLNTLYIVVLLLIPSFAVAQHDSLEPPNSSVSAVDSSCIIENIILVGNEHTKNFVILREMTTKIGSVILSEQLEYDKNRIYSLGLFNQVNIKVKQSTSGKATLVVEVNERWYLFPYPILGIRDRDWNKWYYGLGILHNNFRGRNDKLIGTLVLGYDPSAAIAYRNPFLSEEGAFFLDTRLAYNKVRNKSLHSLVDQGNFDEQHFSFFVSLGKRFGLAHAVWVNAGYEIVEITNYTSTYARSLDGKDKYPIFSIGYSYDTRDLYEYPSYGTFARGTITKFGLPKGDVDVIRYAGDLSRFIPLVSDFVLAGRVFTDIAAAGPTPSYNRVYFGYGERIRGHFTEIMEGDCIFGFSSELHYPLLQAKYFKVDFLPPAFGIWRFGVTVAAFADAGTTWFRGEPLALNSLTKGYGLGIHLLLPYSTVVRVEYAWNEARRGQFIVDVGSMFR
jgi:outer membrane protein assembly factor BamA